MVSVSQPHDADRGSDGPLELSDYYAEALKMIPGLWREMEAVGRDPSRFVLELKDGDGQVVLAVPFADHAATFRD